jgi:hypothetical protein
MDKSIAYNKRIRQFIVFNGEQYAVFTKPSMAIRFFLGIDR